MKILTLHSDVKGAAGSSVLVLSQAAVLAIPLRRDLLNLQHRQLISSDGAYQLPVLQPGEGWCRASLGTTVQRKCAPLLNSHRFIYHGLTGWVCNKIVFFFHFAQIAEIHYQ